jgi:hypothetical protein
MVHFCTIALVSLSYTVICAFWMQCVVPILVDLRFIIIMEIWFVALLIQNWYKHAFHKHRFVQSESCCKASAEEFGGFSS